VACHRQCIERAARSIGGADDIERVAVGRESEPAVGLGNARRVRGYDRERGGVCKRDCLRGISGEKYRERERRPARPNGTACAPARSDGDAAAARGRTGCRVCWNFQGSPPRTQQPTCVRAGRPSPYSAGLVPAARHATRAVTSGAIEKVPRSIVVVAFAAAGVRPSVTDDAIVLDDVVTLHLDAWSTPPIVGPLDDDGGRGIVGIRGPIVRVFDRRGDEATTEPQAQGDESGASVDAIHAVLLDRDVRAWSSNAAANPLKCKPWTTLRSGQKACSRSRRHAARRAAPTLG